ncbi:MAG: S49 family peptidase [Gammaproteobacteria bacterium]
MNTNASFNISEDLVKQLIKNQRSDRRWKNFRFLITLLLIVAIIFAFFDFSGIMSPSKEQDPYVALVRMDGMIMANQRFSAKNVVPELNQAFADKNAKGVVLLIDSGGGSPVQASIIYDKILELKKEYKKKVVVVSADLLASGAYMVAMGGDKVYATHDTITGSIGVVMEGFGFTDAIKKLGIDRRIITAGKNKVQLDPFEPEKPENVAKAKKLLDQVHQHFIQIVMDSRGKRLKGDKKEIFSGDFWIGATAVKLGVVDEVGNLSQALSKEFNVKHYVDYTTQPSLMEVLLHGMQTKLNFGLELSSPHLISEV